MTAPGDEAMAEAAPAVWACPRCRARSRTLTLAVDRLDRQRHDRARLAAVLALPDEQLRPALGLLSPGQQELSLSSCRAPVEHRAAPGLAVCRHCPDYPSGLLDLVSPPAVLYLAGAPRRVLDLLAGPVVAIVGTRRPTQYGREVARDLAAGLGASGVCVLSGMAMGIDSAAHLGALSRGGPTLAVMPGGADVAYPACAGALHRRLLREAGAVSELEPGTRPRRWCFIARNRIIAALARLVVIVEAGERSGALVTAGYAADLGREVAAVPGSVTSGRSTGSHALLRDGAHLVGGVQDMLDILYGVGVAQARRDAPKLEPADRRLLEHVRDGHDTPDALVARGLAPDQVLAGLTRLVLAGWLRHTPGGHYLPVLR